MRSFELLIERINLTFPFHPLMFGGYSSFFSLSTAILATCLLPINTSCRQGAKVRALP